MLSKKAQVLSVVLGSAAVGATAAQADEIVNYSEGKVSDTRYELIAKSDTDMRCGKEMKEKMKECKRLMKEASCGSCGKEMKEKMKECKEMMEKHKAKEMSCGKCGSKMKDKSKEMNCGSMM